MDVGQTDTAKDMNVQEIKPRRLLVSQNRTYRKSSYLCKERFNVKYYVWSVNQPPKFSCSWLSLFCLKKGKLTYVGFNEVK